MLKQSVQQQIAKMLREVFSDISTLESPFERFP